MLKDLCDVFAPMKDTALTEEKLTGLIRDWYVRCNPQQLPLPAEDQHEALHTIRKRAKHARYMAEFAPKTAVRAQRLAERFEAVQQIGGAWHDWLQLQDVATKNLGKSAQLPQRFAARAERSLRAYKGRLAKLIFH